MRDNLRVMDSETRCHFVNPKYEELHGQPCYPSLDALPERPDVAVVALNPLRAASVTEAAPRPACPRSIIPGGGVVEGGPAAAAMQAEVARIAREHGLALLGPNCMGVIDLDRQQRHLHRRRVALAAARRALPGSPSPARCTDAFVHSGIAIGFSRIISCGSEVVLDVATTWRIAWTTPRRARSSCSSRGSSGRNGSSPWPTARSSSASRSWRSRSAGATRRRRRRWPTPARSRARRGSTDAALDAAGVIRCRDLDELLETAELVEGVRRTGRRVGRGRTGVVTVSTGEASLIADLVPRTGVDLPPIPPPRGPTILAALPTMGYIGNPLDPWGAADPATAYGAAFEAMAASGAYDVLVLVHDFPYRSLASEVATANEVTGALLAATRERPAILPVYVSLTSGEPPPETKALLDGDGHGAPLLRGAVPAFRAIAAVARWERRHGRRRGRAVAARLAGAGGEPDLVRGRPVTRRGGQPGRRWRCPSARAWPSCRPPGSR